MADSFFGGQWWGETVAPSDSDTAYMEMQAKDLEKRPSGRITKALGSFISPQNVDAVIAGGSLTLGSATLHTIDLMMGKSAFPLFANPVLPGSLIFFGGPSPPPLKGFIFCTLASWLTAYVLRALSPHIDSSYAFTVVVGFALVVFKRMNVFFVPSLGIAAFMLSDTTGKMEDPESALRFLAAPWFAGHGLMYGLAHLVSILRRRVRQTLNKAKFKAGLRSAFESDAAIKEAFERYDTSGDGFLEAGELKYAWHAVTGEEMSEEEAVELINSVDTDGDHVIDVNEFVSLVRNM